MSKNNSAPIIHMGEYDPEFIAALIACVANLIDPDISDIEAFNTILPRLDASETLDFEMLVEIINSVKQEAVTPASGIWN